MRSRVCASLSLAIVLSLSVAACLEQREPLLVRTPASDLPATSGPKDEPGRIVAEDERWLLSDAQSIKDLRDTAFGEKEIREFWTRKGWRLTKREERYFAEVQALVEEGAISPTSRWAKVPFSPIYQALRQVKVLGVPVQRMQEFWLEPCENEDEIHLGNPRFKRAHGYEEEHDDGHATDPSGVKKAANDER